MVREGSSERWVVRVGQGRGWGIREVGQGRGPPGGQGGHARG